MQLGEIVTIEVTPGWSHFAPGYGFEGNEVEFGMWLTDEFHHNASVRDGMISIARARKSGDYSHMISGVYQDRFRAAIEKLIAIV